MIIIGLYLITPGKLVKSNDVRENFLDLEIDTISQRFVGSLELFFNLDSVVDRALLSS